MGPVRAPYRRLRHWLLAALIVAGFAGVAGCAEPGRDTLRMGLANAPITLDPRFATDAASARINRLLYRRLVDFDDSSRARPALASWKRLSPTHYRFSLRDKGREFHDGTRLDANDVFATYSSVLDPETQSPHRGTLSLIEHMQVRDPDTIDFFLKRPDPLFPGFLVIGILPEEGVARGHDFARNPVGSGPFEFAAWPGQERLQIRRRRDGQVFEFVHVPDSTVRVLKLLRGEIDLLQNDLSQELVDYLERQKGIRVRHRTGSNFSYIGFNMNDAALAKPEVRRAIAHAIDRDKIIRHLLGAKVRPANALLPPRHWAGNPELAGYAYDPDKARALLRDAGYGPKNPLKLSYRTSTNPLRVRIATIIQRQLSRVGIQVDLRSYDFAAFYADIKKGRFQMYSLQWVGIKSPDIFRYVFHSDSVPPKGANRGRYRDPAADRLIEAAEASDSVEEQAMHFRKLQAHLLETLPYVPLWYEEHFFAARSDVRGYELAPDGNYDGLLDVHRVEGSEAASTPGIQGVR